MVILTDLGALGAAAIVVVLFLMMLPLSRRVFKPGPMFNPEGFARLLVAEIAMHNRSALEKARSEMSVYRTLKRDIDASRQMFLARFPDAEPVYYAALVSILAGSAERLGGYENDKAQNSRFKDS